MKLINILTKGRNFIRSYALDMSEYNSLLESSTKRVEWSIRQFFDLPAEIDYEVESPSFSFSGANWYLRLCTNGETEDNTTGWISLYLAKKLSVVECNVSYRLGVKRADGSDYEIFSNKQIFPLKGLYSGTIKLIERDVLQKFKHNLSPGGILTVFCIICIQDQRLVSSSVEAETQTALTDGIPTLIDNFKDVYISRQHTDITIMVKGKEFLAHKFVLVARSAVFSAMFDHDTTEKNSRRIEITDCDPDSFEQFLLFLYTGEFDAVSSSNAVSLYETAEKYNIKELKEECLRCMANELSADIFCDVFHLATRYNESDLLKSATDFFIINAKLVLCTTKWSDLLVEHPFLCNELILKAL